MNDEQYADWVKQVRVLYPEADANRIIETGSNYQMFPDDRPMNPNEYKDAAVTGPEQHAATIREALIRIAADKELAALDALVALAEDNEGLRFLVDAKQALLEGCQRALEAAEERASQLEHERDEWKREAELSKWPKEAAQEYHRLKVDYPQARREADQLRAALRDIETYFAAEYREGEKPYQAAIVARAALAGVQAKEPT